MPNVVVYVAAGRWKELELQGHDPAEYVREIVKAALSERAGGVPIPAVTGGSVSSGSHERLKPSARSESDREVKPDPKPVKKK